MTTNVENQLIENQLISGVNILFSYYPKSGWSYKDGYLQFEIVEKEPTEVSDEDIKRLNSIGWFKDKEFTNNNWVHPVSGMITNVVNNKNTYNILKGVEILLKYDSNASFKTVSGLDAIIFGDTQHEVNYEDGLALMELGWELETYYTYSWAYFI